jgi:hypothetical protein
MSLPQLPISIKGVADAMLVQFPQIKARMGDAIDLLGSDRIWFAHHTTEGEPVYYVRSKAGDMIYVVAAGSCTCPARGLCYHRVARAIRIQIAANRTAVDFREALALEDSEALALEDSEPPTPTETETHAPASEDLNQCGEHPVFVPPTPLPKRIQSAGSIARGLTIRHSMDKLGKLISEAWVSGPFVVKT